MVAPAPQIKTVDQLKTQIMRPATTSHYECYFPLNNSVNGTGSILNWVNARGLTYTSDKQIYLTLACSEASLPGSTLATHSINDDYTGVGEKHAYRRLYDDRADFTFYVDHNHYVIKLFENWMRYAVNEQDALGVNDPNYNYRVNFPEDYQSEIYINKFEKDYGSSDGNYTEYKFLQAYPVSINSIPVSYDTSQLLKVTVSFVYVRYLINPGSVFAPGLVDSEGEIVGRVEISPGVFQEDILFRNQILRRVNAFGSQVTTGFEGAEVGDLT